MSVSAKAWIDRTAQAWRRKNVAALVFVMLGLRGSASPTFVKWVSHDQQGWWHGPVDFRWRGGFLGATLSLNKRTGSG